MPLEKDFYDIFDISCCATQNEIYNVYLRLAKQYQNENNSEKLSELEQAYAVLSDPEKRKIYDQENDHSGHRSGNHAEQSTNNKDGHPLSSVTIILGVILVFWLEFGKSLVGEGVVQSEKNPSFICKITSGDFMIGDCLTISHNNKKTASLKITGLRHEKHNFQVSIASIGDVVEVSLNDNVSVAKGDIVQSYRHIESNYSDFGGRSSFWGNTSSHSSCCSKCSSRGR